MSAKGQHVQDNSVAERRLRPIYDWLDIGNNKKALQECEKVLKKTPNLQCAKALKGLTLHRMGKEGEAHLILEALQAECPTEEATLQAMTLCYRELQQLDQVCALYESALKLEPTNEELYTQLFMSYVRVFDFKSQQKTAMTLYKHKPKTPYYCWAVMSAILQATRGDGRHDPKKKQLLLSLAERMMEKLILDGKLDAEQEVQLYVIILELQQKYEEIMVVLEGPLGTKLACSNVPQNSLKYLKPLGKWGEINLICKNILLESVDRWDIWKEYISSAFELLDQKTSNNHSHEDEGPDDSAEKCHEFICRIIENGASGFALRGPFLARFELCSRLLKRGSQPSEVLGDPLQLFIEYFRKFGHKPCCVADLRSFLNLLSSTQKMELYSLLIRDVVSSTSVPQSEPQMQMHLCALQISRLCGSHINLSADHLRALVTAFALHYQHGYQAYGTKLLSTDLGPSDPYALLAAHVLFDLSKVEKSTDPIIAALVLLEELLKNSPSNFHAKLLSVRLYHTLGGSLGAQNMYNSLDTKHLQLDSLGFIHCARLPTTGFFFLSGSLFDTTLKFFTSNYKDSCDHITFSYKYGSFVKLDEFMDFRERLNNSMHYNTVAVDRIVLSLVECTNLESLYTNDISPKIDWSNLRDNQDLSVYQTWDPERISGPPEDLPEIASLFAQNIDFLKLRSSALWALSDAVEVVKAPVDNRNKPMDDLKATLNEWRSMIRQIRSANHTPLRQDLVTLPLPSRLHAALNCPYLEVLEASFGVFLGSASEKVGEALQDMIGGIEERLLAEEGSRDLIRRRETMEHIVNITEILCLSSLICLLCNELAKRGQVHKKGKKKVSESGSRESIVAFANSLKKHLDHLGDLVQSWSNFRVTSEACSLLESLNSSNIDIVCENIANSYVFAAREVQRVLKTKVKLLNGIS